MFAHDGFGQQETPQHQEAQSQLLHFVFESAYHGEKNKKTKTTVPQTLPRSSEKDSKAQMHM